MDVWFCNWLSIRSLADLSSTLLVTQRPNRHDRHLADNMPWLSRLTAAGDQVGQVQAARSPDLGETFT